VAPLRIARGIQNKVLEALAMGLPVVGTTPATQGVEGEPGRHYLVADDEDAFYEAVKRLLDAPEEAARPGRPRARLRGGALRVGPLPGAARGDPAGAVRGR
jgi:glycosyltransferase involved in cell wall biosynthesis